MLQKFKIKLNNTAIIDFNVKSIEEFKSKNDYEIMTTKTKCNNFNEIFYCDCS